MKPVVVEEFCGMWRLRAFMSIKQDNLPTLEELKEVLNAYQPKANAERGYLQDGQVRQTFYKGLEDLVKNIRQVRTYH